MPPVGRRCHSSGGRPRQPHPPDIVAERSPWGKNGTGSKNKQGGNSHGKTHGKMFQIKRALIRVEPVCLTV